MATYNEFGDIVPDVPPAAEVGHESTFGASLWAFLHPFQVQQEYAAVGKPVPTVTDVLLGAADDIEVQAVANIERAFDIGRLVALGVAGVAAVYLIRRILK